MIAAISRHGPAGQVDPSSLTAAQLSALRLFAGVRMRRVAHGWRGAGTRRVSLTLAGELALLGLVRIEHAAHPVMVITGNGRMTLAVADERKARRG